MSKGPKIITILTPRRKLCFLPLTPPRPQKKPKICNEQTGGFEQNVSVGQKQEKKVFMFKSVYFSIIRLFLFFCLG